jgi:PAS domain S-box-containing protein
MTKRINLWKKISDIGTLNIPESDRRSVIFLNRINFFIIVLSLLGFMGTILTYCVIQGGKPGIGALRLLLMLISSVLSIVLTHYNRSFSAKIITSVVPVLLLIVLPTIAGDVANEYYYYYPSAGTASAMIPLLLFPKKEDRPVLFILLFFCFLLTITSDNLLSYFSGSGNIPVMFAGRYFFYKLAQILLFLFIVPTVYTLKDLNLKYESILIDQNERLSAQKEELTTQSEELLGLNEELNLANSYLASTNKELENYKNKLEELVELRTSALKDSEERFRNIFENANDAIFIMKGEICIDCNFKASEMFGYSRDQIIGKSAYDLAPEQQYDGSNSKELSRKKIEAVLKGEGQRFEWHYTRSDGRLFDAEVSLNTIKFKEQVFLLAMVRDITLRKRIENELRENKERLQYFVDSLTDWIYSVKLNGDTIVNVSNSEGSLAITGYTPEELQAFPNLAEKFVYKDDLDTFNRHMGKILAGMKASPLEHRLYHRDGTIKWVRSISLPQIDEKGKMIRVDGLITDITDRKMAEVSLKESENNFRNIFEKSMHAIVIVDLKLKILLANRAFYETTGYSQNKNGPAYATDIILKEHHEILFERINRLSIENMLPPLEYKARFKNGEIHFVELTSSAMSYYGEKACLTIIRDITTVKEEEHRVMEAIINSEENERSRISQDLHDGLGPVLSTIKLYFQVYKDTNDESKKAMLAEKLTGTIQEAIKEVSEISHNISPHVFRNYGFYAALKQFVHRIALTNVVKINLDCTTEPELTQNSGIMLYRAICELINNSIKHAACKTISVLIRREGDFIIADYKDDGKGFEIAANSGTHVKGSGLVNIMSRLNALKGSADIISSKDRGMQACLKIPVQPIL